MQPTKLGNSHSFAAAIQSPSFPHNVLYRKGPGSESCHVAVCSQISLVSFSLEQLLTLPLAFKILTLLTITDQLFCQMSFRLSLSNVSSWVDSGSASSAGITEVVVGSHHVLSGSYHLCWSLVWWCYLPDFSTLGLLFVTKKYFVERYFETRQVSYFIYLWMSTPSCVSLFYIVGYKPRPSLFILMPAWAQTLVALLQVGFCVPFTLGALPCFLTQQDVPGSSHAFPALALKSPISPRNPGSFSWRMALRSKIWVLGLSISAALSVL